MLRLDGQGQVILNVTPDEYQAILCSLEAAVVNGKSFDADMRKGIRETWERLIVEGGHVSVKEFGELRRLVRR
jgi:citrate lyase gamma subunit